MTGICKRPIEQDGGPGQGLLLHRHYRLIGSVPWARQTTTGAWWRWWWQMETRSLSNTVRIDSANWMWYNVRDGDQVREGLLDSMDWLWVGTDGRWRRKGELSWGDKVGIVWSGMESGQSRFGESTDCEARGLKEIDRGSGCCEESDFVDYEEVNLESGWIGEISG